MSSPDPIEDPPPAPPPAMDAALPAAVVATILSRLDVCSLLLASAAASAPAPPTPSASSPPSTSSSMPSPSRIPSPPPTNCGQLTHVSCLCACWLVQEVVLTHNLLRPLLPRNPALRSLRLDAARLDDTAVDCLARPGLHELTLHKCNNISGRLLRELSATCRDLRVLSLNSLADRRGLAMTFSNLKALLNGCSSLEMSKA